MQHGAAHQPEHEPAPPHRVPGPAPAADPAAHPAAHPAADPAGEAPGLGARAAQRRLRLMDAAETVFLRDGLRGASMERIAGEAGVARATAYAYFADKEAAFVAVAARVAGRLEALIDAALGAPGPMEERILAAFRAKHALAWQVSRSSPHAADLLAAKDRLAAPVFAASESAIMARLTQAMAGIGAAAGQGPGDAAAWARLLYITASGIAAAAPSEAVLMADLDRAIPALLRAARAG